MSSRIRRVKTGVSKNSSIQVEYTPMAYRRRSAQRRFLADLQCASNSLRMCFRLIALLAPDIRGISDRIADEKLGVAGPEFDVVNAFELERVLDLLLLMADFARDGRQNSLDERGMPGVPLSRGLLHGPRRIEQPL